MAIENTDRLVADAAPAFEQAVLGAETFQALQSELHDFIAVTHDRLKSLSQSVSHGQRMQSIVTQTETSDLTSVYGDPSSEIVEESVLPAERPSDSGTDSPANAVLDEDPMELLNAIKRRIADQMQNAS